MDILSIREDYISGKVDLISFYTDVIKRIEDKKDLNIFLDFSKEKIMERVEFLNNKLKKKEKLGSLFGVSVSVKDNILVKGYKSTCGSKILENYYPIFNATIIVRLLKEDAIILGKVNIAKSALTLLAEPEDDPPGIKLSSRGFFVGPK